MKYFKRKRVNDKGFTLIELMIVVGIIGILVAIAIPNFARYQSKARQSEAKLALAAVYSAEKSFYSEYAGYISSMDAVGYSPEGYKRFYTVGWSATPGTNTGYAGSTGNQSWININNSYGCSGSAIALGPATGADSQTFLVGSSGCIRQSSPNYDAWNMNDQKALSNNVIGL